MPAHLFVSCAALISMCQSSSGSQDGCPTSRILSAFQAKKIKKKRSDVKGEAMSMSEKQNLPQKSPAHFCSGFIGHNWITWSLLASRGWEIQCAFGCTVYLNNIRVMSGKKEKNRYWVSNNRVCHSSVPVLLHLSHKTHFRWELISLVF